VFNYDDFYDVYSTTDHGNEEACETVVNNNVFNYHDYSYDVYEPFEMDWSYFDELVAELCEELELTILEKPLMKDDGAAVVHHDDGVDEVEGEIILWRPAAGLK
jgi:5-methylcytosine-specific restriction endonuclease McrBC regulatory subunit McrC